jgi:hypothetical protein
LIDGGSSVPAVTSTSSHFANRARASNLATSASADASSGRCPKRFAGGLSSAWRSASQRSAAFALGVLLLACHDPPTFFDPPAVIEYGALTVEVTTTGRGRRVDLGGRDSLVVALDSAIQGNGRQQLYVNADSAVYRAVLVGIHQTSIRGMLACTVVGGRDRTFIIEAGRKLIIRYDIQC